MYTSLTRLEHNFVDSVRVVRLLVFVTLLGLAITGPQYFAAVIRWLPVDAEFDYTAHAQMWLTFSVVTTILLTIITNTITAFTTGLRGWPFLVVLALMSYILWLLIRVANSVGTVEAGAEAEAVAVAVAVELSFYGGPLLVALIIIHDLVASTKTPSTKKIIWLLDVPILLGVVATWLVVWQLKRSVTGTIPIEFIYGFAAGATAVQIVIGNVSFEIHDIFDSVRARKIAKENWHE